MFRSPFLEIDWYLLLWDLSERGWEVRDFTRESLWLSRISLGLKWLRFLTGLIWSFGSKFRAKFYCARVALPLCLEASWRCDVDFLSKTSSWTRMGAWLWPCFEEMSSVLSNDFFNSTSFESILSVYSSTFRSNSARLFSNDAFASASFFSASRFCLALSIHRRFAFFYSNIFNSFSVSLLRQISMI